MYLGKNSYTVLNSCFDVLLTVHLSIFISVINQLDSKNVCFTIRLFHASTCFEHMCSKHVEAWNKTYCKTKMLCIKLVNYWKKIKKLVFITERECVYCEVGNQSLCIIQFNISFKTLIRRLVVQERLPVKRLYYLSVKLNFMYEIIDILWIQVQLCWLQTHQWTDTAIKTIDKHNDHIGMVHAFRALQIIRVLIKRSVSDTEIVQLCL